jgi:hypothetical protein
MSHPLPRPRAAHVLAAAVVLASAMPIEAFQRGPGPAGRPAPAELSSASQPPAQAIDEDVDAERTREALYSLLQRYPPSLGRVLKLDSSLLTNAGYLAPYPGLATFLTQHPEIARNPAYFLERINSSPFESFNDPVRRRREDLFNLLAGFVAFLVFLVVTSVVIWIIRMIIAQRRWNRVSKVQFDTHSKLLDRFTSNEDLLAYIQTPAGKRFLESAPIPLEETPSISAPFSRILWSVQAGVVLMIAGLGALYVSSRFIDEAAQFFMVIGVMTSALGGGFIISAIAAYILSRRLGLLEPPAAGHA